jgi:hypothetical protein
MLRGNAHPLNHPIIRKQQIKLLGTRNYIRKIRRSIASDPPIKRIVVRQHRRTGP